MPSPDATLEQLWERHVAYYRLDEESADAERTAFAAGVIRTVSTVMALFVKKASRREMVDALYARAGEAAELAAEPDDLEEWLRVAAAADCRYHPAATVQAGDTIAWAVGDGPPRACEVTRTLLWASGMWIEVATPDGGTAAEQMPPGSRVYVNWAPDQEEDADDEP